MKKVVVLASGGLDSSTVVGMLNEEDVEIYAISFCYAQNHLIEIEKVKIFLKNYNVADHRVVNLDLSAFNTTALINKQIPVPKYKTTDDLGDQIPTTYVPARNTIFLSYALGYAEVIGARELYIGAHKTDSANYPDCRPEYLKSFEDMANLATKFGVEGKKIRVYAPLIHMNKSQIVEMGLKLGVDYSLTISCYDPDSQGKSCGLCHACLVRLRAFDDNGVRDPIAYVPS
jgi:7-cyano-7-deazaguanine synthase